MKDIRDIELDGKSVLIRVDFNVPLSDENEVLDDTRIRSAMPTITYLLHEGARVIVMSHLGRPQKDKAEDGQVKRQKYSLVHIVNRLEESAGVPVHFIDDTVGEAVQHAVSVLRKGEILLLENTRFYTEEKQGDEGFAKQLASLADVYINDAFGTAHRAHASTATVAKFFPEDSKANGLLIKKEIDNARKLTDSPQHPFTAILGGAKVSDKIQLVGQLLDKVDNLVIGGGMAYTFIKAGGGSIGKSLVEDDQLDLARTLLEKSEQNGVNILLPADSLCAKEFEEDAEGVAYPSDKIPEDFMGLDIGQLAIERAKEVISQSATIFWNGPMGVFEFPTFAKGTFGIAAAVAEASDGGAFSLIGGGDSVAAINRSGLADRVSFISTGGGAMLTLLEGGEMPGLMT